MKLSFKQILKYIPPLLFLATLGFLIYHSSLPAEKSSQASAFVSDWLLNIEFFKNLSLKNPNFIDIVRKLFGHFLPYGLLGIFGFLSVFIFVKGSTAQIAVNCALGLVCAALTEAVQMLAESRGPSISDVALNYEGYLTACALLLVLKILFFKQRVELFESEKLSDVFLFLSVTLFASFIYLIFSFSKPSHNFCHTVFIIATLIFLLTIIIENLLFLKHKKL